MPKRAYDEDPMADARGRLLKALGAHIRQARKQQRMTQEMLSEKSGLSPKYISELEAGRRNSSILVIVKIMQALNMTESQFFQFFPSSRSDSRKNVLINEFKEALAQGKVRVALLALNDE